MVAAGRSYTPHVQYMVKYSFVEAEEGRGCTLFGVINNAKAGIIMLLIKNRLSGGDYPKCMEKNMAERSQNSQLLKNHRGPSLEAIFGHFHLLGNSFSNLS